MAKRPVDDAAPKTFDEVWDEELATLDALRRKRKVEGPAFEGDTPRDKAYAGHATGLTFSGGGIRSATFNLGVAQALAKHGLLRRMDYLSTVSGGGYVGSWLTAWIRHRGFDAVEERLPVEHPTVKPGEEPPERSPVSFLRSFSNYLTPRLGLFSADTWAAVATYFRNLILNLLVLVTALSAILLLPRLLVQVSGLLDPAQGQAAPFFVGLALLILAILGMGANVIAIEAHREAEKRWYTSQKAVQLLIAVPLFLAGWLLSITFWFVNAGRESDLRALVLWGLANAGLYFGAWLLVWVGLKLGKQNKGKPRSHWGWLLGTAPVAGLVGGVLAWLTVQSFVWMRRTFFPTELEQPWSLIHATVLGAPGIVLVFILTAVFHIGLMGRTFDDANREWWSRLGGWLMIYGISWLAFNGMAFYAPVVLLWLGGLVTAALGAGWLGGSIGGVLFERKASQSGEETGPSTLQTVVRAVAPQLFVVGLVAFLAFGLHLALDGRHTGDEIARVEKEFSETGEKPAPALAATCDEFWPAPPEGDVPAPPEGDAAAEASGETEEAAEATGSAAGSAAPTSFSSLMRCHSARAWVTLVGGAHAMEHDLSADEPPNSPLVLAAFLFLAIGSVLLSCRVDINQFSMHYFYRNRLIRAYMGASNPDRSPQAFTGFDPDDDFPMADLLPDGPKGYDGPFHLVNINLNLVKGEELAWQQRKGASFVFTPLHTGWAGAADTPAEQTGFRPTREYQTGTRDGISLGMAMAISGAAVSPSMGQGTNSAMSFLLTVFDARLGWWLGNPLKGKKIWPRIGPDVGLYRLLSELFGNTSDRSNYVYLSDGGHFENLGIYELVRRRCRLIVACDGGADTERTFGGLANAMRKCRNDFGVSISIDLDDFVFGAPEEHSEVHCAVGTIHYGDVDPGAPDGTLLFLKTTLTGDEPADVLNYKSAHPDFPNQSTADQFFDEAQFESYRALGYHTVETVFEDLDPASLRDLSHAELCDALRHALCEKRKERKETGRSDAGSPALS